MHVTLQQADSAEKSIDGPSPELLARIRSVAPAASLSSSSPAAATYHLKAKDSATVEKVLSLIEAERSSLGVASYDVHGTSMEDIFLSLMKQHGQGLPGGGEPEMTDKDGISDEVSDSVHHAPKMLTLTSGRGRSPLSQALTIFHKRALVARRSWLTPFLAVGIAIAGACIPINFITSRGNTCATVFDDTFSEPLYLPSIFTFPPSLEDPESEILTSPPNIAATLGSTAVDLPTDNVQDNATFVQTIRQNFMNLTEGGVSIDLQSGNSLVAWEASPPGSIGPVMLNLANNILFNRALNASGKALSSPSIISANYQPFPGIDAGTLFALKWVAFFGAAMVRSLI